MLNFLKRVLSCEKFKTYFNSHLQRTEVCVADVFFIKAGFNHQLCCLEKTYEYLIYASLGNDWSHIRFKCSSCWPLENNLNIEKLKQALE